MGAQTNLTLLTSANTNLTLHYMPLPPALGHPPTHIQLEKMIRVAECLEDQL